MAKKSHWFARRDIALWAAFALFIIACFLRFWRIEEFITFLGDQGRDAIVLKRIVTFEHFPAIGAPTSVGQVFLGPFYYYFIAPWLWLTQLNPLGPALGVATFSSLLVLVNYFAVKDLFDRTTALISSTLITFSAVLVEFSRFSWNPNLLPLFSLLTLYTTIAAVKKHSWPYYFLAGTFLSLSIQLHYLALFMAPAIATVFLIDLALNKKKWLMGVKNIVISFLAFVLFQAPLIVFDLKNNFLNIKSFIKVFQVSSATQGTNKVAELVQTFFYLNKHLFQIEPNATLLAALLLAIVILFFLFIKTNRTFTYVSIFFFFSLAGLSLYSGPKHPHYFGAIYTLYILLFSYLLSVLAKSKLSMPLLALFLAGFIYLNYPGYFFLTALGANQIERAQIIAKTIKDTNPKKGYAVTALPDQYSDSTYRYFLEIWGVRPLEKDTLEPATELYVLCEGKCKPIGNPQWDIAYFRPKKVIDRLEVLPSVTMYRLRN